MLDKQRDVLDPLTQGGNPESYRVEPVEEVIPEASVLDGILQVPVGGGDHPHIHLSCHRFPHPLEFPVLQKAEQLHLRRRGDLPDLVQENRSSVRRLKPPLPVAHSPREGPPDMPEELALQERLGKRCAVDCEKRKAGPRTPLMNEVRQQFLPRSAFPLDQHGDGTGGHLRREVEHRFHRRAARDELARGRALPQFLPEETDLILQHVMLVDALREPAQLRVLERFLQVVECTLLDRFDSGIDRPMRRHQHHRRVGRELPDLAENLHPVDGLHLQVDEGEIECPLPHRLHGLDRAGIGGDEEPGGLQRNRDRLEDVRLVVHQEHRRRPRHVPASVDDATTPLTGSVNENVLPFPTSLATQIFPPHASTISFAMASPSPTLPGVVSVRCLICTNRSKIFSQCSSAIPWPVSWTAMRSISPCSRAVSRTFPP